MQTQEVDDKEMNIKNLKVSDRTLDRLKRLVTASMALGSKVVLLLDFWEGYHKYKPQIDRLIQEGTIKQV